MSALNNIIETSKNMFKIPELRRRIFVLISLLLVYRIGYHIPIPGINPSDVLARFTDPDNPLSNVLGTFSMLSGGSLLTATLFALGIMPYISSQIIFQLLTKVIPRLEELSKEGEAGRRKINQYSRYTTVAICVVQAFFVIMLLRTNDVVGPEFGSGFTLLAVLTMTAGTFFLIWLGEMITEHGIGNGISLIIMAGIVAMLPVALYGLYERAVEDNSQIIGIVMLLGGFVAITAAVCTITLGQRRIPIQHAKYARGRRVYGGQRSDLALKVDQPGVIPIIFASALLTFPAMITQAVVPTLTPDTFLHRAMSALNLDLASGGFVYIFLYVVMVFFFCFFWTKLMFNPVELAKNMKEYGSFIPGVRPGRQTIKHIDYVVNRITLAGATFLSMIAVMPLVLTKIFGLPMMITGFLGGTGLLISVGVALDLVHKIEGHLKMRHYDGFLGHGGPKFKGRRG